MPAEPAPHHIERVTLAPSLETCRLLNGMWQVSGAHGVIDPAAALRAMLACVDLGLTTFDLADHYGPAEDFVGEFRGRLVAVRGTAAATSFQAFTKWVPYPEQMTRRVVETAVDRSLRRMATERLDMLQFHWWEYGDQGYLDALQQLAKLRTEGKIQELGVTNFDTQHLDVIVKAGIPIVSNQVQFSLIDMRPLVGMVPYCRAQQIGLLAYGTLCGGMLSDAYLGRTEPARQELNTASLGKYKQMIDAWGGWALFQELLAQLRRIADRHDVSIASVATRFILDQPAVAGVIIGARLGLTNHAADSLRVFELRLTEQDRGEIAAVQRKSRDLYRLIGDCGDEYRR